MAGNGKRLDETPRVDPAFKLQEISQTGVPPQGQIVQPSPANRWVRRSYKGITPEVLSATITKAERGETEDWADLTSFILRTDPHVRAVVETRSLAIVGAEIEVTPGEAKPGQEQAAQAAADFVKRELDNFNGLESFLGWLLHAENVGWAGAEHNWQRINGEWHSEPHVIQPRDIEFNADWSIRVRTYPETGLSNDWIDTREEPAARFIFHVPAKIDVPTISGDLMAISWQWLFKRWAEIFRNTGLERFANPFISGTLPENATPDTRENLLNGLKNLSGDQVAIFESGTGIEIAEVSKAPGEAWTKAIDALNNEITKAILGSTLNTEVGTTGGNRALGESQFATTILPRLRAMSKRVSGTLEEQWFDPLLQFNAHLFGGRKPPIPSLELVLVADEPPPVTVGMATLAVNAGIVTKDQLLIAAGFEPMGAPEGEQLVPPEEPAGGVAPGFAHEPTDVKTEEAGNDPPAPFPRATNHRVKSARRSSPRQTSLPLTSARKRISPTSSTYRSRIASVPFDRSGGHES